MQQIRLIFMTLLLTVLIWAVADHSLTETATLTVRLELVGEVPGMRIDAQELPADHVRIQVSGPRSTITRLKARDVLRLVVSNRAPGPYVLQLVDEVRGTPGELSDVVIQSISPPSINVLVDRDSTVTVGVKVDSGTIEFDGYPVIEPSQVQLTVAELQYRDLPQDERWIILDGDVYFTQDAEGQMLSKTIALPAELGNDGIPVRNLNPSTVEVRYKLKERQKTATIPAVPIKFEASRDIFNGYEVRVRDAGPIDTQRVTIKGPPAIIDRIVAGEIKLTGVISLTAADKAHPGAYRFVAPKFDLPPGVDLIGNAESIEFALVARSE